MNITSKTIITTPSLLSVDKTFDDDRFMKVRIDVLESDVEARGHGIRFSRECLKKSRDSFANIPILAHVIKKQDSKGNEELDYGSHDFHIEADKFNDTEGRIIYDEICVGIIPESNNLEIKDNEIGHAILSVDAFLFKDYGGYVCDILQKRGGETSVSAELECLEMKYVKDDDITEVDLCTACGVTLLGDDVDPAIPNAKAVMFSSKTEDRQSQLIDIMQELKKSLDKYTNTVLSVNKERKEETQMNQKYFEELLSQYGKTAAELSFDYKNMSNEELKAAFEQLSDNNNSKDNDDVESVGSANNTIELSIKFGENTKNFAKSLTDVICAITDLVNNTYASDGDFYDCAVYDEGTAKSKVVIMNGLYSGKSYRQNWQLKDGNYTLKGEREEVFSEFLTQSERDQLNSMRANYAALSAELDNVKEQLAKHQAEPEKMEILQADEYSQIAETDEYKELLENHFDVTKEDLSAKLDSILLAQVKANAKKVDFSAKQPETSGVKIFPTGDDEAGSGRYGNMFADQN